MEKRRIKISKTFALAIGIAAFIYTVFLETINRFIPITGADLSFLYSVKLSVWLLLGIGFIVTLFLFYSSHRNRIVNYTLALYGCMLLYLIFLFAFVPSTQTQFQNSDRLRFYYETGFELPLKMDHYEWYQTEPNFLGDGTDSLSFSLDEEALADWQASIELQWLPGPTAHSYATEDEHISQLAAAFTNPSAIQHILIDRTKNPSDGFEYWNTTAIEVDTKASWVRVVHSDM